KEFVEETSLSEIGKAIDELNWEYMKTNRSFHIIHVAGGYQMVTRESYSQWVRKLFQKRSRSKLSQAALETLSMIAFKQPVARSEIVGIRGVNCDGVLQTLLERKLVTIAGRSDGPGRPLLYATTKEFLRYFGVNELSDLPKPKEIEEILKESGNKPDVEAVLDSTNKTEDSEKIKNATQ
ncbi:SMC-Scp complex subunit ScpB, partial [bacterium]|nr:SMC-Scp complex subunit ScpB [bacterium]